MREFLSSHTDIASKYGELEMKLADQFPKDIVGYCNGKNDSVKQIEEEALIWNKKAK